MDSSETVGVAQLIDSLCTENYLDRYKTLKQFFYDFRYNRNQPEKSDNAKVVRVLLEMHKKLYCQNGNKGTEQIRRHNIFVRYFYMKQELRDVAMHECISYRIASRDVHIVMDEMMILVYGVDGVMWS